MIEKTRIIYFDSDAEFEDWASTCLMYSTQNSSISGVSLSSAAKSISYSIMSEYSKPLLDKLSYPYLLTQTQKDVGAVSSSLVQQDIVSHKGTNETLP